jgi:hypothetical protein
LIKGIHIQPARATEEIRLNFQNVEKSQSDQIKIIELGMLAKSFFLDLACNSTKNNIFEKFIFSLVIITQMIKP